MHHGHHHHHHAVTISTESKVHLKSHHGKFLCAEPSGKVVADRSDCKEWETWTMRTTNGRATFQSAHGKYLCAEPSGKLVADRSSPSDWEHFHVVHQGAH
ncbi:PPOD2 peroxidase, partial [Acanthamoeba castellanii str. Neff]